MLRRKDYEEYAWGVEGVLDVQCYESVPFTLLCVVERSLGVRLSFDHEMETHMKKHLPGGVSLRLVYVP